MQFMLLFSRQGKLRLQKWYVAHPDKVKKKITRELVTTILARKPKMCSFLEWKDLKIVYKRCVLKEILIDLNFYCKEFGFYTVFLIIIPLFLYKNCFRFPYLLFLISKELQWCSIEKEGEGGVTTEQLLNMCQKNVHYTI